MLGLTVIFIFILVAGLNSILFDKLIFIQYKSHNDHWIKDGKPIGTLFVPQEASILWGSVSRNRLLAKWYFVTPVWVNNDSEAQRALFYYRIAGIAFPVYFVSVILFFSLF